MPDDDPDVTTAHGDPGSEGVPPRPGTGTAGGERPPVEHPAIDPGALHPDPEDVDRRSVLLPEEASVGSGDPHAQAEVILEESEARTEVPNAAPDTHLERRTPDDRL